MSRVENSLAAGPLGALVAHGFAMSLTLGWENEQLLFKFCAVGRGWAMLRAESGS
jgi:hypothetical protein